MKEFVIKSNFDENALGEMAVVAVDSITFEFVANLGTFGVYGFQPFMGVDSVLRSKGYNTKLMKFDVDGRVKIEKPEQEACQWANEPMGYIK